MQVIKPDLAPSAPGWIRPYKRIADYAGADNVKTFQAIVDKYHRAKG